MVMRKAVKASFDGRKSKGKSTRRNGATAVTKGSRLREKRNKKEEKMFLVVFKERASLSVTFSIPQINIFCSLPRLRLFGRLSEASLRETGNDKAVDF